MKLRVAWIGKTKSAEIRALSDEYLKRLGRYVAVEPSEPATEAALLKQLEKAGGRTAPVLVLLDARGRQMTSEELATFLKKHEDGGTQTLLFAVGGADGFCDATRRAAGHLLSLGKMTLPHELARVILLEQLYRAYTILKKHPYHTGH
jgi:23S rRNA (pseudouridine1915-N3)-methyltransferase